MASERPGAGLDGGEGDDLDLDRMEECGRNDFGMPQIGTRFCDVTDNATALDLVAPVHAPSRFTRVIFLKMGPENKTNTEETVFLEDLEYSAPKMSQGPSSSQDSTTSNNRAPSGSQKRQRTLEDMFTSNPNSSAKKLKLIPSQPRPSPLNALTKLNSIPFSFAAFVESLSDEHRQLLHLECETMGKSWYVEQNGPGPVVDTRLGRLKLLHTEIRKPYFIALKTFLRQEGVMGVDDTPLPLKVYPPRSFSL